MCGIAGVVAPTARRYEARVKRMMTALEHRGPDADGMASFGGCVLGHRRLSIVDLEHGGQPMFGANEQAPVAIVFNGEIYGYRTLRDRCAGYPFRTSSDTEVILALYARYGSACVSHLPGMFAFALWDEGAGELLCARDRFGEKPLYYAFGDDGEFIFGSEIKAILASGLVTPELDPGAVRTYLERLYVHPATTIYSNVFALPPAHLLRVRGGSITVERYWSLPDVREGIDSVEAAGELERLLDAAVQKQLVADVPVSAFLSGGLDSSTIVALAVRHSPHLRTFAFGFEDGASELPYARAVASLHGTAHDEASDSGSDIAELLWTMQQVYDEPFADSSNIPTYLLSKLARERGKVVLTGDGGDEMLGGYSAWYRPLHVAETIGGNAALTLVARAAARAARAANLNWSTLKYAAAGLRLARQHESILDAHAAQQRYFSDADMRQLGLAPAPRPALDRSRPDTLDAAIRADIADYMPGDILVKIDRASMAHGLELRAPFLDVDVASFCLTLPTRLKVSVRSDKVILRRAMSRVWPREVRTRRKMGFGAPVSAWLERPSVRALVRDYLDDPTRSVFRLVSFEGSRPMVAANTYQTWTLLVLSLWLETRPSAARASIAGHTAAGAHAIP